VGAHHASGTTPPEQPDRGQDPDALDEWGALHEQVERLPEEERQVVDLLFYQGLSQADAAVVLGVSVRTLQRRWHAALIRLHETLRENPPS
jgi:RNA polymerase sigma factor (sigma-70 family)